jgi:uncharacterized BrkB/YihY/UPF0761 family membrane protein
MKYYFTCPNCGSDKEFAVPSENSLGLGCLLFIFGGLIPAILYADARRRRVVCTSCHHIFRQPSLPRTPVSILATWIIGVLLLAGILVVLLLLFPELAILVPQHRWIEAAHDLFMLNSRGALLVMVATFVLLAAISFIASVVSNVKAHKKLRETHEIRPK